ncbi:hypothetical protein Cpir12675_002927 [Ceratocystis pirilliformis]|uniref:Uncharacterized protein n=1 Tax=Ceratocystis pirilliformis TaxID=259994 RepID=A0ABR3Z7H1_9PEZI
MRAIVANIAANATTAFPQTSSRQSQLSFLPTPRSESSPPHSFEITEPYETNEAALTPRANSSTSGSSSSVRTPRLTTDIAKYSGSLDIFKVLHFWDPGCFAQNAIHQLFKSIRAQEDRTFPVVAAWHFTIASYLEQSNATLQEAELPLDWQISYDGDRYLKLIITEGGVPRKEALLVYCQAPQPSRLCEIQSWPNNNSTSHDTAKITSLKINAQPIPNSPISCAGEDVIGGTGIQHEQWFLAIETATRKLKATSPQSILQVVIALGACSLWLIWDPNTPRYPPLWLNPRRMDGWEHVYYKDPIRSFEWYLDKHLHLVPQGVQTSEPSGEILPSAFLGLNYWASFSAGVNGLGVKQIRRELNTYSLLNIEQSLLQVFNFQSAGMDGYRSHIIQHRGSAEWEIGGRDTQALVPWADGEAKKRKGSSS